MNGFKRTRSFLLGITLIALAGGAFGGCTAVPFLGGQGTPTASVVLEVTATPQPALETPTSNVVTPRVTSLEIWVPPQFWAEEEAPGQALLRERLEEFSARRPQIEVNVRVKALTGPGGILESLRASQAAAPLALPDVILLSRSLMEQAAQEELISTLDESTNILGEDDWYDFARELSEYEGQLLGVPFAGDVYLLSYRNGVVNSAPADWEEIIAVGEPLAFPAADPQALLPMILYNSVGGQFVPEEEDESLLNEELLLEVFTFIERCREANVMPYWLTQFETNQQAWAAYEENQAQMAFVWSSDFILDPPQNTSLTPIPSREGTSFSMANGWVWSVVGTHEEQLALSVELVEFLAAEEFIADWTLETGYVPPRPKALSRWQDGEIRAVLLKVLPGAQLLPPRETLQAMGPLMRDAVVSILKDQVDAQTALQELTAQQEAP